MLQNGVLEVAHGHFHQGFCIGAVFMIFTPAFLHIPTIYIDARCGRRPERTRVRFLSGVMLIILSPTHDGEGLATEGKARFGGGRDQDWESEDN